MTDNKVDSKEKCISLITCVVVCVFIFLRVLKIEKYNINILRYVVGHVFYYNYCFIKSETFFDLIITRDGRINHHIWFLNVLITY